MDFDDRIPVIIRHILESNISQYAGIIYEDIDPSEGMDGGLYNPVTALHTVVICNGFSTLCRDLIDNQICSFV